MGLSIKEENSKEDFLLYLEDCNYQLDEEKSSKDTKKADWYKNVISLPDGVELIIEVRLWDVIDIFATIVDWTNEVKGQQEGFAINIKKAGYTIQGYEIGLKFTVGFATEAYRKESGDFDFGIDRNEIGYKVI